MEEIGKIIKTIRQSEKLSLKEMSQKLDMDMSLLSRIERGERLPTSTQIEKVCNLYSALSHKLQVSWLSTKILSDIKPYDHIALEAIQIAEEAIKYKNQKA